MIVISVPNTDEIVEIEESGEQDFNGKPKLKGTLTPPWGNFLDQQTQQMQQSLSDEGFWIPSQSGTNLTTIAASLGQQGGANAGTVVFDPTVINGGSAGSPNGQLKILLADGVFHLIPNM